MSPLRFGLVFVALVVAALGEACGGLTGDACDQYGTAETELSNKGTTCGTGTNGTSFDLAKCKANLATQCTDSDRQQVTSYARCVDQLVSCTTDIITMWSFSAYVCEEDLEQVTTSCRASALAL